MSDTVKLVIEIPKAMYEDIKTGKDGYSNYVHTAIRNGTPLDSVRAEIEHMACRQYEHRLMLDRQETLEILDNIGKESEGKNETT